jgi:hypothetical protein
MKNSVFFLSLTLAFVASCKLAASDDSYRSGYEPPLPEPFPAAYKDYQILPGTVSPNGKLTLIYPKRSVLRDLDDSGLYLAQLKPFAIIIELPCVNITWNHGDYSSEWAKDGTALIFEELSKWGPDRVSLVPVQDGKAGKIVDLAAEVRNKMKPFFTKSHAARFNDDRDYIFDADHPDRWHPGNGKVEIDCTCTTDPKSLEPKGWTATFEGTWDIVRGRFLDCKVRRLPNHLIDGDLIDEYRPPPSTTGH